MPLQDFEMGARANHDKDGFQHWKYPSTVGSDTYQDDINFNSHEDSEYAKKRMGTIDQMTNEPFMMFEFLKVDGTPNKNNSSFAQQGKKGYNWTSAFIKSNAAGGIGLAADLLNQDNTVGRGTNRENAIMTAAGGQNSATVNAGVTNGKALEDSKGLIEAYTTPVRRTYTGSICLYMPTGIEITDAVAYNDNTRQFAAGLNEMVAGGGSNPFNNKAVLASTQAISVYGAAAGKIGGGAMLGALAGYGVGDIIATEMQRSTGALLNKNEFAAYGSTPLRTFSFNWTILPDSEQESDQAAGLIKFFRESMHATKNNQVTITVPDHCIVSFHGSRDMIQLPPVVVENVGVTYNPNNSSFFRRNNSPVEIALTIGLKEINPLYKDDIKAGY
jgi:hypothetical protein